MTARGAQDRKSSAHSEHSELLWPPEGSAQVLDLSPAGSPPVRAQERTAASSAAAPRGWTATQEKERDVKQQPTTGRAQLSTTRGRGSRLARIARRLRSRSALPYIALVLLAALALTESIFLLRRGRPAEAPVTRIAARPIAPHPVATTGAAGIDTANPAAPGRLTIRTQPAGASVVVDGERQGTAPVAVNNLAPGDHDVLVRTRHGELRQQVRVAPGEAVTVLVPLAAVPTTQAASRPAKGFMVVNAPVELQVVEGDRVVGTSAMARLRLDAGAHTLTLRNDDIGFEEQRTVSVSPGKTTALVVAPPTQRVAVNAAPWAEVSVDNRRVGETPLGTLDLPLGPHTFVFRHPDLGEKTVRVVVRGDQPARVSVDMRK